MQQHFGKPVLLHQSKSPHFEEFAEAWEEMVFDTPAPERPDMALTEIRTLFARHRFTHVVAPQKLLWYSDILERVAKENGAALTWCENFFDGRVLFDKAGLQYTRLNDLAFDALMTRIEPPLLPTQTREAQPQTGEAARLHAEVDRENTVVVLGQVPHDMALREYPGLGYEQWLEALFTANPGTTFLFKHHPLVPTPGIEAHSNVVQVKDDIQSLFLHFRYFAAFSSTTIFEGCIRGRRFVTGGHHFCSGTGITLEAPTDVSRVVARLRAHRCRDLQRWSRRLAFVCNHYSLPLDGREFFDRITLPSSEFFQRRFGRASAR